jgi:hypothetical protein
MKNGRPIPEETEGFCFRFLPEKVYLCVVLDSKAAGTVTCNVYSALRLTDDDECGNYSTA